MYNKARKIFKAMMVILFILFIAGCTTKCTNHIDANNDKLCDICNEALDEEKCNNHLDENKDKSCDICNEAIEEEKCENHIDENKDKLCDKCNEQLKRETSTKLSTKANDIFFPTQRSNLHNEELVQAFEKHKEEKKLNIDSWGEYIIYNYISEEKSKQYNMDIFEVYTLERSLFYVKHNEDFYPVFPFDMNNDNSHCITHIAITDINEDGYIEILTAAVAFAQRKNSFYFNSFIYVTDTYTKMSIQVYGWDSLNYFKEDMKNVICIYKTDNIKPRAEDLVNGKLDEKYYESAKWLYDTPKLNTTTYTFNEKKLSTSCELYKVDIVINDENLEFPYLFKNTLGFPSFSVNVIMTYLGETFSYTHPNGYLDGATVTFVNEKGTVEAEGFGVTDVMSKFIIFKGMEIDRTYRFNETINHENNAGTYDLVINYQNKQNNINE